MPLRKASKARARKLTWGGVLPKILKAIVEALPEGGASPVAPEPAITITAISLTEESIESAAMTLGITVEELLSLPKQSVIGLEDGYVLARTRYHGSEDMIIAAFGDSAVSLEITIDLFQRIVSINYQ